MPFHLSRKNIPLPEDRTVDVKVKVCGITNAPDALHTLKCGADFFGMVFYPKSPRHVTMEKASRILEVLKEQGHSSPPAIGVFVNEKRERIIKIQASLGLFAVQLHGEESPLFCHELPCRVIKAIRVKNPDSMKEIDKYRVWAILCDAFDPRKRGGTGKRIDAAMLRPYVPHHTIFLAGGLDPGNVKEALRQIVPFAVDVSSGVERTPGRKDPDKVRAFIAAVKGQEF